MTIREQQDRPGSSVNPAEFLCMVRLAVPDTSGRVTFPKPSFVSCTKEKALLPDRVNSTTPLEGPRSCVGDAEMTVAENVTYSHASARHVSCAMPHAQWHQSTRSQFPCS